MRLQRSGGLAGLSLRSEVDSDDLASDERQQLESLLDQAELSGPQVPPRGADRFQYDLEVERGGSVQRATAYDGSMPPGFRALTEWLTARSRRA